MNVISFPREKAGGLTSISTSASPGFPPPSPGFAFASQAQDLTVATCRREL